MMTRRLRLRGYIEVLMEIPSNISLEEIEWQFKDAAQDGKFFLKRVTLVGDDNIETPLDMRKKA